jgi:hypothetical protein
MTSRQAPELVRNEHHCEVVALSDANDFLFHWARIGIDVNLHTESLAELTD